MVIGGVSNRNPNSQTVIRVYSFFLLNLRDCAKVIAALTVFFRGGYDPFHPRLQGEATHCRWLTFPECVIVIAIVPGYSRGFKTKNSLMS